MQTYNLLQHSNIIKAEIPSRPGATQGKGPREGKSQLLFPPSVKVRGRACSYRSGTTSGYMEHFRAPESWPGFLISCHASISSLYNHFQMGEPLGGWRCSSRPGADHQSHCYQSAVQTSSYKPPQTPRGHCYRAPVLISVLML